MQTRDAVQQARVHPLGEAYQLGRPDLAGAYAGVKAYLDKDYTSAMKSFKRGARYGDKLSQLSIGLMYLNGEGVAQNAATAWAWLDLAAGHDNPGYVATRDQVWSQLDASQRQQAEAAREALADTYADAVTGPRLRNAMGYVRISLSTNAPTQPDRVAAATMTPVHAN
ncbi:MAG TPA: hypothetical protein VFN09_09950 [Rhodanobacteraceae bacterium]|nr:hypothetical protein [Rhodanobacteraceae bacterium]